MTQCTAPTLVSSEAKFLVLDWGIQSTSRLWHRFVDYIPQSATTKLASGVNLIYYPEQETYPAPEDKNFTRDNIICYVL